MSKPASPVSQQFINHPVNSNQHHSESDGGIRVLFHNSSSGNHIGSYPNSAKASIEIHDGQETEQPGVESPLLMKNSTNT
jgi:hypothetical protein